jgi:hypothetical protein
VKTLRSLFIYTVVLVSLMSGTVHAEIPVRFILARQVIMADRLPSPYLPEANDLDLAFRSRFEAAFPHQVLNLDSSDQMISPDERVIVIVPTITFARLTDELKAGDVHNFSALVVGGVSAIDPWTDANLYSGTRLFSSNFEIGDSVISHKDVAARDNFKISVDKWLDATIDQMKSNLAPFVLDAPTLAIPEKAKQFKGGIWPFGSERGVKVGQTLNGGPGHYAKVVASFQKYSLITDTSNPLRTIRAGEHYSLTLVDKPTDRPEPSIELSWLGNPPSAAAGDQTEVLSSGAMVSLFDNYLSKGEGVKILPPGIDNPQTKEQLNKLAQEISSHSKLVAGNVGSFERENLVIKAASNPDFRIEIGVLERYHGTKAKPDGTIENYYRLTLAASVEERIGSEDAPLYAIVSVVKQAEELANVEAIGIRKLDPSGTYLTLYRNAVIHLASKVQESSITPHQVGTLQEAIVTPGGIDWKGAKPGSFAPMSWLRPAGEVLGNDGKPIGTLYRFMQPAQGYLNLSVVAKEKLEAGDVLRYQSDSKLARPVVALELMTRGALPAWLPESSWLLRFAGNSFGLADDVQIVPLQEGETVPFGVQKISFVKVAALGASSQGQTVTFTGQWRCLVRAQESEPDAPPLLQIGIQSDSPVTLKNAGPSLQPLDTGGWGLDYTLNALTSLTAAGGQQGIKKVFFAVN